MRASRVGAWALAAACTAVALPALVAAPATAVAGSKVTICHRTHSTTNPYRRITVGISAVNGSGSNDHTHHWAALFDPTYAYPPNAKVWGDIIPVGNGGQTGSNWSAAGQAMYASSDCGALSAQAFYNAEREAGVAKDVILADLTEQGADGDPATFTTLTYTGTTPGVTDTDPPPVITTTTDPAVNPQVSPSASPSPSTSPSPAASPSPSESPSPTASPSDSPSPSPSASPSESPSASSSPSPAASPSATPAAPAAASPSPTPTLVPSATPQSSPDAAPPAVQTPAAPTPAEVPSPTALDEPQPTPTPTAPVITTPPVLPPAVFPAADGSVTGIAWFDRNDNGTVDPREWLLPAVPVTLTAVPALRTAGLLRAQAVPTSYSRTVTTAADGSYRFTGLPAGAYRVAAVLQEPGFTYTSDTDGLADWQVGVAVTTAGPAVADFAGLGTGRLTGQVLDTVERHPVSAADVRCTWAGFDDVFGTADDVVMTDVADSRGGYDWSGVPYGAFTCVGKDPVRGTVSSAATVRVVSAVPVHATLPLGLRVDVAPRLSALPRTGVSADTAAAGAAWLILLGVGVLWYTRRSSDR